MILISQGPARVITRTDIIGLTLELHMTQISRKKVNLSMQSSYVGLLKPAQWPTSYENQFSLLFHALPSLFKPTVGESNFKRWEIEPNFLLLCVYIIQWIRLSWLIVLCLYKEEAHISFCLILSWLPPTFQMARTNVISLFLYSQSQL